MTMRAPIPRRGRCSLSRGSEAAGAKPDPARLAPPEADALFSVALDKFVDERNRLAAALSRAGRREEAAVVKRLARPSISAWATNQAVRRDPAALRTLLSASEDLRQAQSSGSPDQATRTRYQTALAAQRQAVTTLVEGARQALDESGHADRQAILGRVETNLRRAAVDAAARSTLHAGRLMRDVDVADFDSLMHAIPLRPVAEKPARQVGAKGGQPDREAAARDQDAKRAASEAAERQRKLRTTLVATVTAAARDAKAAHRTAERAHEQAEESLAELGRLRKELEQAERRSTEHAAASQAATAAQHDAERRLDQARAALAAVDRRDDG